MKIDPGLKQVTLPSTVENRPAKPQPATSAPAEQTDVNLSQRAAQLKELESSLAAIPAVDRSRVESIKEAIASGQYVIKPENIAAGLLDSVREMLNVSR